MENVRCNDVQELADKAMDVGVELGIEVVNRYETNVVNTAADGMDLLDTVNRRYRFSFPGIPA